MEEWGESGWQGDVTPYRGKDTPLLQLYPWHMVCMIATHRGGQDRFQCTSTQYSSSAPVHSTVQVHQYSSSKTLNSSVSLHQYRVQFHCTSTQCSSSEPFHSAVSVHQYSVQFHRTSSQCSSSAHVHSTVPVHQYT